MLNQSGPCCFKVQLKNIFGQLGKKQKTYTITKKKQQVIYTS